MFGHLLFKEVFACSGVASLRDDFTHPYPLHVGIRRMVCGTCLLKDGLDGLLKRIGIEWLT
jgi:hypothetical protein